MNHFTLVYWNSVYTQICFNSSVAATWLYFILLLDIQIFALFLVGWCHAKIDVGLEIALCFTLSLWKQNFAVIFIDFLQFSIMYNEIIM
jgi:hypothetical protein